MAVEPDSTRLDGSTPHTILDLQTWEEFEEKLKELQKKAPPALRPEPFPFLYRGQENSCWTITTTLERLLDGRESMGHPVNGEVGTWLAPSGSQICSPFACPYSRLQ